MKEEMLELWITAIEHRITDISGTPHVKMRLDHDLVTSVLKTDGFLRSFKLLNSQITPESVQILVDLTDNLLRVGNIMNGGAIATIMDFVGGLVVMNDESIINEVTTNLSIDFISPVARGPITVEARIIKRGKTLAYVHIDLYDSDHVLCSTALGTWFIFR
jgi:uncharacterized protein (TIGR00369 family)